MVIPPVRTVITLLSISFNIDFDSVLPIFIVVVVVVIVPYPCCFVVCFFALIAVWPASFPFVFCPLRCCSV